MDINLIDSMSPETKNNNEQEAVNVIETTLPTEVVIEMDEVVGWVGGDHTMHYSMAGRDDDDQHPISAITGLSDELDKIKSLKPVLSNKIGIANYYKWSDGAHDEVGYFVSVEPGTSFIKICGGEDIFGVAVNEAGFVGGQDQKAPKDSSYGLIMTSGLVNVRCELDVEVGDNVISNSHGYAKKTDSDYGYKVLARGNNDGIEYVVILLGVQADKINVLGEDLIALSERVGNNEVNIVSAINVANQAYNKSQEAAVSSSVSEEAIKKALESVLKSEEKIDEFETIVGASSAISAQARDIAETAATSAEALKTEAIHRANDAWAKADEVQTETQSLCAKIDRYSVGEYSQAYGLTLEQARCILQPSMIYVPTEHINAPYHKEEYVITDNESYIRWFTPGYLYEWDFLGDKYGWRTVGNNNTVTNDENYADSENAIPPSVGPWVFFSIVEPVVNTSWEYGYWYTNGDVITSQDGDTDKYESYTLYKWESNHWIAVATLKGNASNRMVSEIYQTTNQITMGVSNPRGCIAALDVRVQDTEADIQSLTEWQNGGEVSKAIIRQHAEDGNASIVISTMIETDAGVEEQAKMVLNTSKTDGSALVMSADNIDFEAQNYSIHASKIVLDGDTTFTTDVDGETKIHGGNIATGTIDTEQLSANAITAEKIAADAITSRNYYIKDDNGNYTDEKSGDGMKLDLSNGTWDSTYFKIDEKGKIICRGGRIAGWYIDSDAILSDLYIQDGEFLSGKTITGIISSNGSSEAKVDGNPVIIKDYYKSLVKDTTSPVRFIAGSKPIFNAETEISDAYIDITDSAPFVVLEDGSLYARAANISGHFDAESGSIGNLKIDKYGLQFEKQENKYNANDFTSSASVPYYIYKIGEKFKFSMDQIQGAELLFESQYTIRFKSSLADIQKIILKYNDEWNSSRDLVGMGVWRSQDGGRSAEFIDFQYKTRDEFYNEINMDTSFINEDFSLCLFFNYTPYDATGVQIMWTDTKVNLTSEGYKGTIIPVNRTSSTGLKPLYIDEFGRICTLSTQ